MSKEGGQDDDDDKSNIQNYCKTYFDDGTLTCANRYSIKEKSHDSANQDYDNNNKMYEEFVNVVNSQQNFN
jgi:hypothetical protein